MGGEVDDAVLTESQVTEDRQSSRIAQTAEQARRS
jgi:hypothetical protein